jgi:hypothetical protein
MAALPVGTQKKSRSGLCGLLSVETVVRDDLYETQYKGTGVDDANSEAFPGWKTRARTVIDAGPFRQEARPAISPAGGK